MLESIRRQCERIVAGKIINFQPLSGGDINEAYRIETAQNRFFIKYNTVPFALSMFETEAKGLELLASTKAIKIPTVIGVGQSENAAFLVLEYLEPSYRPPDFWVKFGQSLATLHRHQALEFGLDHDNFIGTLPQPNSQKANWDEFYITNRLSPLIKKAFDKKLLTTNDLKASQNLFPKIPSICPNENPSLIHGDLWNGNFLIAPNREAVLIDPAVYYSHREMDIAMTQLFGGFDDDFYQSYQESFPLEQGLESRLEIYHLYYWLVHLVLFGGTYVNSVKNILKRFA